jgi:uncharacterized protein YsxB (DUF464 family)
LLENFQGTPAAKSVLADLINLGKGIIQVAQQILPSAERYLAHERMLSNQKDVEFRKLSSTTLSQIEAIEKRFSEEISLEEFDKILDQFLDLKNHYVEEVDELSLKMKTMYNSFSEHKAIIYKLFNIESKSHPLEENLKFTSLLNLNKSMLDQIETIEKKLSKGISTEEADAISNQVNGLRDHYQNALSNFIDIKSKDPNIFDKLEKIQSKIDDLK